MVNRRAALGTGAAALGGAALGAGLTAAAACAQTTPTALPSASDLDANLNTSPHLFHLTAAEINPGGECPPGSITSIRPPDSVDRGR